MPGQVVTFSNNPVFGERCDEGNNHIGELQLIASEKLFNSHSFFSFRLEFEDGNPAVRAFYIQVCFIVRAERPAVDSQIAFLAAKAELALAEGRPVDARRDLEVAIATARRADRTVRELSLRLQVARVLRSRCTFHIAQRIDNDVIYRRSGNRYHFGAAVM